MPRLNWATVATWSLLSGRCVHAFVDDVLVSQEVGPALLLLPALAVSRGNLLSAGALVEVELELTLAAGYSLEYLPLGGVPVQLGLWQHDELTAASTAPVAGGGASSSVQPALLPPLSAASVAQHCGCSAYGDDELEQQQTQQQQTQGGGGGASLEGQDCGAPYMLDAAARPASSSRFVTVLVGAGDPSSSSSDSSSSSSDRPLLRVRWNATVSVGGLYHWGLAHCAPPAVSASGVVRWTRAGTGGSKGGSLPDGILGIVPFYGTLACAYFVLAVGWAVRVRQFWDYTIALQLAVFAFLLANLLYSALAFAYYLHLDLDTDLRARQVATPSTPKEHVGPLSNRFWIRERAGESK
jgi:hypothetical protein